MNKKCRGIVAFFAISTSAKEKFVQVQLQVNPNATTLRLVQDVDTRWNSMYMMLKRFITLRKPLSLILCEKDMPENLSNEEWKFAETLTNILEPMKDVTELMCGETYPTLSHYIPMYIGLINIYSTYETEDNIITEMCQHVTSELQVILLFYY